MATTIELSDCMEALEMALATVRAFANNELARPIGIVVNHYSLTWAQDTATVIIAQLDKMRA